MSGRTNSGFDTAHVKSTGHFFASERLKYESGKSVKNDMKFHDTTKLRGQDFIENLMKQI